MIFEYNNLTKVVSQSFPLTFSFGVVQITAHGVAPCPGRERHK